MRTEGNRAPGQRTRATAEQRLDTIERNVSCLNDAVDQLYRMVREQGRLITEYVTRQMVAAGSDGGQNGGVSPEDALFTFVCRRKFDEVEKELARLRQMLASGSVCRVG
jgi:hypothetical protein